MIKAACQIEGHDGARIKYFCIDSKCLYPDKLVSKGCAECFLEHHEFHNKVTTEELLQQTQQKASQMVQLTKPGEEMQLEIEKDFEEYNEQMSGRLNSLKVHLKAQSNNTFNIITNERKEHKNKLAKKIQQAQTQFKIPMKSLTKKKMLKLQEFYLDLEEMNDKYTESMTNLANEEAQFIMAKEKYLTKMNYVVKTLVEELQVEVSPEKYDDDKTDTQSQNKKGTPHSNITTPQKQISKGSLQTTPWKQSVEVFQICRQTRRTLFVNYAQKNTFQVNKRIRKEVHC